MTWRICYNQRYYSVTVNESVLQEFEKVKYMTSTYAIFKLSHDNTEFVVDRAGNDHDWETFLRDMPENEPRLAVADFRYKIGDEERYMQFKTIRHSPSIANLLTKEQNDLCCLVPGRRQS
jgi:hypothetical protein